MWRAFNLKTGRKVRDSASSAGSSAGLTLWGSSTLFSELEDSHIHAAGLIDLLVYLLFLLFMILYLLT